MLTRTFKYILRVLGNSENRTFKLIIQHKEYNIISFASIFSVYKLPYFLRYNTGSLKFTGTRRSKENSKHCQNKRHTLRHQMMRQVDQLHCIIC